MLGIWERNENKQREKSRGRGGERELDHYSNVINDSLICMCRTINHSQVNVTDRRLSFPAANRMNFDNINSIPLFPALIHFALFFCLGHRMLWLSNYRQNLLNHISRQKQARRAVEEPNYFSLFHCQVINKTLLSASDVQPGDFRIFALSAIKYLGFFFFFYTLSNNLRFLSGLHI